MIHNHLTFLFQQYIKIFSDIFVWKPVCIYLNATFNSILYIKIRVTFFSNFRFITFRDNGTLYVSSLYSKFLYVHSCMKEREKYIREFLEMNKTERKCVQREYIIHFFYLFTISFKYFQQFLNLAPIMHCHSYCKIFVILLHSAVCVQNTKLVLKFFHLYLKIKRFFFWKKNILCKSCFSNR